MAGQCKIIDGNKQVDHAAKAAATSNATTPTTKMKVEHVLLLIF